MKSREKRTASVDDIMKKSRIYSKRLDQEIESTKRNADKIEKDIVSIFNKMRFLL